MNPIQIQSANPAASLPIIDGLSDTYKIVATGTLTTAAFTGPGARSAAVSINTGQAFAPAYLAWAQQSSGTGAYQCPAITWNTVNGQLLESFTVDLSTLGTTQTLTANTNAGVGWPEVTRTYRYAILAETAF